MTYIIISGAKEGNLKDISLEMPRNKLIVFTGLSGSGKSTLAVDIIFQECQRQYLEAIGLQGIRMFEEKLKFYIKGENGIYYS